MRLLFFVYWSLLFVNIVFRSFEGKFMREGCGQDGRVGQPRTHLFLQTHQTHNYLQSSYVYEQPKKYPTIFYVDAYIERKEQWERLEGKRHIIIRTHKWKEYHNYRGPLKWMARFKPHIRLTSPRDPARKDKPSEHLMLKTHRLSIQKICRAIGNRKSTP